MGRRRHLSVLSSLGLVALVLIIATAHAGGHARGAGAITQPQGMDDDGVGSMMRSMVGSRPPSCAGRCWWCGRRRCVAVQVPITPQEQDKSRRHGRGSAAGGGGGGLRSTRDGSRGASSAAAAAAHHQHQQRRRPSTSTSSYDDHSNYKPLSWRCRCGGG